MRDEDRIYIPYAQARNLIQEADLFLYRGGAWYSYIIKKITRGEYSHIGLASWHNGCKNTSAILETIEFHGYRGGGVTFHASALFPKYSGLIDVYRPSPTREDLFYNPFTQTTYCKKIVFSPKDVTRTMRNLTGIPYGWRRVLWFACSYLLGLRFFYSTNDLTCDRLCPIIYPVCSTAVAYSFHKNNFKLIHSRSDAWTSPSDLALSPLTNYLFTIT